MASIHLPIFTKGEWTLCRGFSPFQAVDMLLSSVATASPRRLDQTGTTSLLLATLTDLARSKSELVAENALLRKPLIILRRRVKRPACTKSDRMLLVLLARMVRTWKKAHITRPGRRLSYGGIARAFSSFGSTSRGLLLLHQGSPRSLWP